MDGSRGHVTDARVAMGLVVPRKEPLAMATGILNTSEADREIRPILQRFELGLGIGIVIRDIGSAMGLGDIQVDQQGSHRLAAHAGTAIGMQRQRVRRDVVLGHRLGDQLLGQLGGFPQGDHPADDIAAENIQDHIQVETGPFGRAFEFRDIPAPDLVGRGSQELRLGVDRVHPLAPALRRLAVRLQGAVQGAHRADVAPLVQQGGIDKIRRAIGEAFAVEHLQQLLPLIGRERQRSWRTWHQRCRRGQQEAPAGILAIDRTAVQIQGGASRSQADLRGQLVEGLHQQHSLGVSSAGSPSKAQSFFWTSMMALA